MKISVDNKIQSCSNIIIFDYKKCYSLISKELFYNAKEQVKSNESEYKKNKLLSFTSIIKEFNKIILVDENIDDKVLKKVFTSLYIDSNSTISLVFGDSFNDQKISEIVQKLHLFLYSFDTYKKREDYISSITIVKKDSKKFNKILEEQNIITDAIYKTRDLVNIPPSDLNPKSFCDYIKKEFKGTKVKVEIFEEKELIKKGLICIEAVSRGSNVKSALARLEIGKEYKNKPIVLVGKGVTYDAGGINIKPSSGGFLSEMKDDMTGAATVLHVFKALYEMNIKKRVICYLPLAENMLGAAAYKPGDILKSYNGKTIEVKNTDAEGRLILADAISYASKNDNPDTIIDVATLTGASIVALGFDYTPFYSNSKELSENIKKASKNVSEKVWEMPLDNCYLKYIEGEISDLKNIHEGMNAGSITAAKFLEQFVGKNIKWSHFDIGGTVVFKETNVLGKKGPSGVLVKTLIELILNSL